MRSLVVDDLSALPVKLLDGYRGLRREPEVGIVLDAGEGEPGRYRAVSIDLPDGDIWQKCSPSTVIDVVGLSIVVAGDDDYPVEVPEHLRPIGEGRFAGAWIAFAFDLLPTSLDSPPRPARALVLVDRAGRLHMARATRVNSLDRETVATVEQIGSRGRIGDALVRLARRVVAQEVA